MPRGRSLDGVFRPEQLGLVVADCGNAACLAEAARQQPGGDAAHLGGDFAPRDPLPDAEGLAPHRHRVRGRGRVAQDQLGQRVGGRVEHQAAPR